SFGSLPGTQLSQELASTTLTALQAFNLGFPSLYLQGFGDPIVASTNPFYATYLQSSWKARKNLTLDLGMRYEVDGHRSPLPVDTNNVAPRFGFAWDPRASGKTTVRGGYGIFYAPT